MDDQPQGVDADPLERMIGYLGEEENATPAEAENEAEETEPDVEEESQEETETAPEAEEAVEVIIHNGEEKQLTKTELKELAQQGFDYTQKTQQLAEQRRYVEQQAQLVQQQAQFAAQFTDQIAEVKALDSQLAQYKAVDWSVWAEQVVQLSQSDPYQAQGEMAKYQAAQQKYQQLKDAHNEKLQGLNQLQTQAQQVQAQQSAQRLQMEAQAMKQAIPEWKNEAVATAEMGELKQWLIKSGLDERDIGSITDHRQVAIARKAMLYDKMMASGKQKVAAVPPTAKPGSVAKPTRTIDQKARETLRRTGNAEIAAKLIERML